jgi:L-ascorbate metabolism protein UlaG (beta-lactamase superfamily)
MRRPVLKDSEFVGDVCAARDEPDRLHLWWLGQSGFLAHWQGRHLLLDPYLSDALTTKYAGTDKPHVRMTERVVAPDALDFIDVVTSSHLHTDHCDAETVGPLRRVNPNLAIVIPEANRADVAARLRCAEDVPIGLTAGASVVAGGFTFHGVPAAHDDLACDERGRHHFMGYVVECGPWRIYHSGDTLRFADMERWLAPHQVDVALLPINGHRPERRVAGNLEGREAAALSRAIGAGVVIPCHYDMFEFNTASPDEFMTACLELGQRYAILRNGERWTSPAAKVAA